MSEIAIRCESLGKQYRIGQRERYRALRDKLTEAMLAPVRKVSAAFKGNGHQPAKSDDLIWALKDVSFEIKHGEVIGVIGRNGAGKSTLLKILSRITEPTTGQVAIHGRVGSLLEVGTGFHPELTGRENIFLNGAILGMSQAEIRRKFDEIVDFAGIERFVDTPVKHYSSGMHTRLAFAVAAHLDPEILLIDEVLAVGDVHFQKKCIGKMNEVAEAGKTILFVSHNMSTVKHLCAKGMVLKSGKLDYFGSIDECVNYYLVEGETAKKTIKEHITKKDRVLEITAITVNGSTKDELVIPKDMGTIVVEVKGELLQPTRMEMEIVISDNNDFPLAFFSPGHEKGQTSVYAQGEFSISRAIVLPDRLSRGDYYLNLSLTDPHIVGYLDATRCVKLSIEGFTTATGRSIEYSWGRGWLFLKEAGQ